MYINPRRRGGPSGVAGVRARQVPVGVHEGSYRDYLCRHEQEANRAVHDDDLRARIIEQLFERTADPRNLMCAWERLASGDGQTPGIDGMSYSDLEPFEVWNLLRTVSKAIHADTYRVAPDLIRKIPKTSGQGTRTLSIPTVIDRVVQRAMMQTIQPVLDPWFDERSHGYRPGKDRHLSLAMAERLTMTEDRWVWVTEDIQNAFDHVPQGRLFDVVRAQLPNHLLINLMGRIVRTTSGQGLRQGSSLSPLLLNVYLDRLLDRKWRKRHPTVPLIRVADDLLLLCKTVEEAFNAREALAQLLQVVGLPLKGSRDTAVCNLSGRHDAHWLGFHLAGQGR
jgi:retron-type reverse transcriptase